ncbi:DUF3352 domain-containing protein [Paradesertivirga mongoliensis]|uniref:DUF3352 domain-containing protein n=1 Tax=Paradesertivirga mongoliensis TaxID=2100740 RepID=A0ABW4ZQH6_9SPHI|nr:DUF3352 domain-containing protein [Pedobacter mongoliensis]
MRNIIILCTILIFAIAALAAKYFSVLAGRGDNITKVLNYIPADAALVLQFNNDQSFYEIFKDYKPFNAIIGKHRAAEISRLKDLLNTPTLSENTSDTKVFLSFHHGKDSLEFLYSMNLGKELSTENIQEVVSDIPNLTIKALYNDVYALQFSSFKKPLYLLLRQGIAIASFSEDLVKKCIDPQAAHLSNEAVEEIHKISTKNFNSPVNLFINHPVVSPFLKHFALGKAQGNSALLANLKGSSALSMNFKSDAVMFNGISSVDSLELNYLNLFLHQKSAPNTIKKILPENTSTFLAFGLSDVKRFHNDLKAYFKKRNELQKLEEQITSIKTTTGVDLNRDLKPLLDKEFVSVENSYGEAFAIIKVTNGRDVNFKLQLISRQVNEFVSQVNHSHIFYYYFGEPLKKFPRPYFGVADNYLIIANMPGIITNFLSVYESERFLHQTEDFKRHDQLVANQSNIFYFLNVKRSSRLVRTHLKPGYAELLDKEDSELKQFNGLSYQWTSDGGHFFTNFYLSYNPTDSIALNN